MGTVHKIPLTSMEIGMLWNQYMIDTMSVCVEKVALATVQDEQIRQLIQDSLQMLEEKIEQIRVFFQNEGIPIPMGFTDEEINLDAPSLYTDIYRLKYLKYKYRIRLGQNGLNLARSIHEDVRHFYQDYSRIVIDIDERVTRLLLDRGLLIRTPYISVPDSIEFVHGSTFMGSFFGSDERKLLAIEIANLCSHIMNNLVGKTLLTGFAQVVESAEIRNYILRGIDIANKQIDIFSTVLREENIPVPMLHDIGVTNSTVAPFSNKLMLYHISVLNAIGIATCGTMMSEFMRKDLITDCVRLAAEVGLYLEDGANILIDNGWMEQPPKAVDHMELRLQ